MLDGTPPTSGREGVAARPYLSRMLTFQVALERWQLSDYHRLRAQVFCGEQRLFAGPDAERDAHDLTATPIVAVAYSAGTPEAVVGVVRIYPGEPGTYWGGRLAVAPAYRKRRDVGAGLIRKAVCTAHGLGCGRFLATVQSENAAYFARHHFRPLRPVLVCGRPHVLMEADLSAYPAEPLAHCRLAA